MWKLILFFVLISCSNVALSKYEGAKLLRVYPKTEQHLHLLEELPDRKELKDDTEEAISFWRYPRSTDSSADLLVPQVHLVDVENVLAAADIPTETLIHNVKEAIDEEAHVIRKREDTEDFYSSYHSYESIHQRLQSLKEKYPDILEIEVIGTTEGKKDLVMAKAKKENGNSDKMVYFIEGGAHAREWITPATAMYLLEHVLEDQSILEESDVYVVPVLNPDGYEYSRDHDRMWRKNRSVNDNVSCRGTDLNRNFDVEWEKGRRMACKIDYAGKSVQSEPEVKALATTLEQLPRLDLYLCLHSYGQMWFSPWAFTTEGPPTSEKLNKIGRESVKRLKEKRGVNYEYGSPGSLLYTATGSSMDWAYREMGKKNGDGVIYAVEMRPRGSKGFLLPATEIKDAAEDMVEGLKCMHYLLKKKGEVCDY